MKRNLLLLAMLSMFAFNAVLANETEPNNTRAQANTLPLNGSNSGAISPAADVDWYKVTTNADGKLNVTLNPATGVPTYIEIYDNNGTTQLAAQYGYSSFTLSVDGLAAGTYYIKVHCYYSSDVVNYTISNTLTTIAQANDTEPDSTRAQALTLPLNGSVTGHIGYYYNNHRDSVDWYKVTTNGDGRLRLRITSNNGQNVYANLFDNNGTTLFTSQYTSSTLDINTDGLAAGTYYIRINTYYTTEFAPYTLADSLFKPTQVNDTEPDSTKAQALTLPLNGSVTGHIGYYYNNHRDSVDWYKVTTNGDGILRLRITSNNGQNVYANLFDNNGTTLLASQYTSSTRDISTDGLAAGTYYVRVNTYYTTEFAPYTLADSLFKPAQANDAEPNSIISQAVTLDTNKTVSGHIGYYYNNHRDTFDWYKLTIPLDGMIKLVISSKNGQNVYANLFDGDGTTVLNSQYTSSSLVINTDGLAAGTYYVRVNNYYTNSEFAPYTLTDSLKQYHYSGNSALNKYFSQGLIIPANGASTGHVGFYYNHKRDTIDTWKINYTGVNGGSMTLTFNQEAHLSNGSIPPTYFQVYHDTAVAPISTGYYYASSGNLVLTNLTQDYYYVKVFEYYNSDFSAYQITTAFTQVNIANISIKSKVNAPDCSPTNSLSFKVEDSKPPYTVKLYRFDTLYATKTVNNSKEFSFINLPYGVYRADAYGAGATGTAYDSYTSTLAAVPTNLSATKIEDTQARLGWSNTQPCVSYYDVEYRPVGTTEWKDRNTDGNKSYYYAKSLIPNTNYEWRVIPVDSALGVKGKGNASVISTFKTTSGGARYVQAGSDDIDLAKSPTASLDADKRAFEVYPNPAVSQFRVQFNPAKSTGNVSLSLVGINGNTLWNKTNVPAASANGTVVDVNKLPAGIYLLHVTDHNGNIIASKKVVVSK